MGGQPVLFSNRHEWQVYTVSVYTILVLDGLRSFDWDLHNIGHVARHGVPGRYLVLVFTIRNKRLRCITVHTMNRRERRIYGPEIGRTE
jgi:hypothetical protein